MINIDNPTKCPCARMLTSCIFKKWVFLILVDNLQNRHVIPFFTLCAPYEYQYLVKKSYRSPDLLTIRHG